MKKLILLSLLTSIYSFAQTKLYVHPDGEAYASKTETIAILPLKVQVKLRPKQLKDFTTEQIIQMQKDEALDIQKGMHSWFLTRKKRGSFNKTVQAPTRTNALLKKAGVDIYAASEHLPSELGEILGVDCVIMGNLRHLNLCQLQPVLLLVLYLVLLELLNQQLVT